MLRCHNITISFVGNWGGEREGIHGDFGFDEYIQFMLAFSRIKHQDVEIILRQSSTDFKRAVTCV